MFTMDVAQLARLTAGGGTEAAPAENDPEKILKAAREFESIWLEQMLHSARPSDEASMTGEPDSTRDMVLDMADQQVARMLAAQGGLGLAAMVQKGLHQTPAPVTTTQKITS
jgi:Rod binding domain-containing protein